MTPREAFTKVLIQTALNVDCEKIAAAMAATDWRWASINGVPDAQEVRQNLSELVNWLIDNFNSMHLVNDGDTVAQAYSGGWYYIISHWPPSEYRITIIHGHSGQGDNICE